MESVARAAPDRQEEGTVQELVSHSSRETERFGEEFASTLGPGSVVALFGELGSGKTTFVKGVCLGLGFRGDVTSPTFTFIHEYAGQLPIYHFDCYRIDDGREMRQLGCDEYFYGTGVCLIEWADKIREFLPEMRLEVHFRHDFDESSHVHRKITIRQP